MMPSDHPAEDQPEADGETTAGSGRAVNTDAVVTFRVTFADRDRSAQFLAAADGSAYLNLGDLASAAALDGFEEAVKQWSGQLRTDRGDWQHEFAEVVSSAYQHANTRVWAMLGERSQATAPGVALSAAALVGSWLCVANAGSGRIYRLSQGILEPLTPNAHTHRGIPNQELRGVAAGAPNPDPPAIEFHQLRPGDIVLVCTDGLGQALDDGVITSLLYSSDPPEVMARGLILAGQARGGRDDMSAVVARVGEATRTSLPGFLQHLINAPETPEKGRVYFGQPSNWSWRTAFFTMAACAVVLVAGVAMFQPYLFSRHRVEAPEMGTTVLPQGEAPLAALPATPAPTSTDTFAATAPDTAPVSRVAPTPVVAAPQERTAAPPRTPRPAPESSAPAAAAAVRTPSASDSTAEQIRQATIERIKDSIIVAENAKIAAQHAADSTAKAYNDSVTRAEALRASQDSSERAANVAAAERARQERVASGNKALSDWLTTAGSASAAGQIDNPVFKVAPPPFVEFVRKNRPALKAIKITNSRVDQQIAEANVEWVATWKTAFGTTKTKPMKATVSLLYYDGTWSPRTWYITEGAP